MEARGSGDVASGSVSNTKDESKDQYEAAFLKGIAHGITYQVKILTWVAWKLLYKGDARMKNWCLATEVRNARGLHDLVLRYEVDDASRVVGGTPNKNYMYRFVQIKHKGCLNKGDDISVAYLMSKEKKRNQYSLSYLFKSYVDMIRNFEKIMPEQILDITIFTNLGMKAMVFMVPVDRDKILDFEGKGKRYRIDLNKFLEYHGDIIAHLYNKIIRNNDLILDFLSKLVFAVSQPSESEMEKLITEEMGKIFSVPQIFYNDLYRKMIEWFLIYNDGKAPYLTEERLMQYLCDAGNMLSNAKDTEMYTINDASSLSEVFSSLKI